MAGRIEGKRALILGAAPGNVGGAIAARFAAEGAQVVVAARRPDAVEALAREVGGHGLVCDITVEADIARTVADAAERMGGLDLGVNATGWGLLTPFLEHTREQLEAMCALQFTGPFQFFQALLRVMTAEGASGGGIIQISSVTTQIMMDDHAAYMGTKAGIDHVIRCIAHEFGHLGVRANSIAPGGVADAPMSAGGLNLAPVAELYGREIPLVRPGVSRDVADAALWLASDEASFVTGQVIHVSGGQTLRRNPRLAEVHKLFGELAAQSAAD